MILEIVHARGLTILIDGQRPAERDWGYGNDDSGFLIDGGLKFKDITINTIASNVPFDEVEPDNLPNWITINDDRKFKVDKVVRGDPDNEEATTVTLANGETIEIDEITLYIKATLITVDYTELFESNTTHDLARKLLSMPVDVISNIESTDGKARIYVGEWTDEEMETW
jgi:hypothetical protein